MSTEIKNLQATAANLVHRFDDLRGGPETRGWGGEKWAKFCDKIEDLRDAVKLMDSAAPTPGDTEIVDWLENISSTAYPVKIGKTLSGQPWVVCESGHYPGSDLRDCLRAALQRPARDGGVTPFRAYVADPDNQTNEYAERVKRANPSTPKEQP